MEVHVRHVPQQSTENALRNFLKPYFLKLSIRFVHCQKQRDKPFASLTFLHISDGQKFLSQHGQTSALPNGRPIPMTLVSINLRFLGQPIYCEKSRRVPDPWLILALAKDEKDHLTRVTTLSTTIDHAKGPEIFPVVFGCLSVSCGVWTYVNTDLVFSPQISWTVNGTAKFGERSMILMFDSGLRIDFLYISTLGITTEEGSSPSFIFSMHEPPRFFQKISSPLADLMEQLGINNSLNPLQGMVRKNGPQRHRLPCLDDQHKTTAGSCLVYRVLLKQDLAQAHESSQIGDRMQALRKVHGIPPLLHRRTKLYQPRETWADQFRRLQQSLSSSSIGISFLIAFQIQKLAQDGYLLPHTITNLLPDIQRMALRSTTQVCVATIRKLFNQIPFPGPETEFKEFEEESLLDLLRENEKQCKREAMVDNPRMSSNVAIIHRAKITPTGVHLYGPEAESSNRVLRKYPNHHEYFLRVQFCDENGQPVRFNPRVSNEKIFHGRFKSVLENGINIAGREYGFLGFSHSSLRAQSCWFMAPFIYDGSLMYDRMIIQDLGNFSVIRSPAKCAARIGQVFSDTRTAISIDPAIVKITSDVETNNRVFSDGVGTMSASIMESICERLGNKSLSRPTCFQIRYSGAKGMISLDSRLQGNVLVLRPSMIKFDGSTSTDIEICEAAYRPLPMYLNRQFIKILEDMGVDDSFFLKLQAKEVQRLRMITASPVNASTFLKQQSIGDSIHLPWLISKLAMLNLDFRIDGFLRNVVEMALLIELRLLKHKTRIPVDKGWHLHGLMDETGLLEEGQIYCVVVEEGRSKFITGKNLIISRAPALHPGDVQLVEGVVPPAGSPLLNLSNCICFSSKGDRDLPSQLSGGDLDGDRYYIMWDKNARPKRYFTPADYPRQIPIDIGRTVGRDDMTDFFIQFMETDQLGRIAVLHRILADQKEDGTRHGDCVTLAGMHSTAVDFSKTGIPVDMSKMPKYNPYRPDFEAPGPHVTIQSREGICFDEPASRDPDALDDEDDDFTTYKYYESEKVLGKLYRAIDERKIFEEIKHRAERHGTTSESSVIDAVWAYVQQKCRLIQWDHKLEWARDIRDIYEECLHNIMNDYSEHPLRPLSELEAFIGNILGKTGAQSKHQRELSTTLKERFNVDALFIVNCIVKEGLERSEEALERSMACLAVSLEERIVFKRRERLLSFKYVAAAVCLREVERMF